MKVQFERTGGFAAIHTSLSLDTDSLPREESEKIKTMFEKANFFNLPQKEEVKTGADYFHYKITLETNDNKHTIETTDLSITPELEEIVSFFSNRVQTTK
jgi:hypothetical protein